MTGLLNTPQEFKGPADSPEFKDKVYLVRKSNQTEQALFVSWLEKRAKDACGRSTDLPEEVQDKMLAGVMHDIIAGDYEWGGPQYLEAARKPHGLAYLIHLQLREKNPECDFDFCKRMVLERFGEIARFILGAESQADPKVKEALAVIFPDLFGSPSVSSTSNSRTNRTARRRKKSRS